MEDTFVGNVTSGTRIVGVSV